MVSYLDLVGLWPIREMSALGELHCKHDAGSLIETLALFLCMICVDDTAALPSTVYQVYPLEAKAPA